jgi:hypothetical protein
VQASLRPHFLQIMRLRCLQNAGENVAKDDRRTKQEKALVHSSLTATPVIQT